MNPIKGPENLIQTMMMLGIVNSNQNSGTEAIRTQIQPLKPKQEIANITNSQSTKRTYGQPSNQLFPKR